MSGELRTEIVGQFEKLNLECNQELKHMVIFAAKLCKTPVSFITLLDRKNETLKVQHGLENNAIPVQLTGCMQNMKRNDVLVVEDTKKDARFTPHPDTLEEHQVRFCAVVPLITHGNCRIGTLCVMDYKPHVFTLQEKLIFKIIARHIISVMELRLSLFHLDKSFKELKEERETRHGNEIKLRSMFESLTDAYYLLGKRGELIDFNKAAYNFIKDKFDKELTHGCILINILSPNCQEGFIYHVNKALKGQKSQMELAEDYGTKGKVWWDCTFDPVRNNHGQIIGVSYVTRDITERKVSEQKIIGQNHLLTKIAEIQSHDYRGPVASILGLMNLIESEGYIASKEYLLMMQSAVNKLDEKIHEVVNIVTIFD